ncbi:MAG: hypothetical protein FWF05_07665 [Oscillospiraceae bacterium]|nr:hypothetical protein [Oscillospiraceae bacterium]
MKKLSILLTAVLLICLAACGGDPIAPDVSHVQQTQTAAATESNTTAPGTSAAVTKAPDDISEQLYFDAFRPAFELARAFTTNTVASDSSDSIKQNGVYYYRVTDPRFISFSAMEATLREVFSEELTQEIMGMSPFDYPLYIERGNRIYARGGRGFPTAMPASFSIEEQNDDKVVYKVRVMYMTGEEKDFSYTRELIGGEWIFTKFPMEWLQIMS